MDESMVPRDGLECKNRSGTGDGGREGCQGCGRLPSVSLFEGSYYSHGERVGRIELCLEPGGLRQKTTIETGLADHYVPERRLSGRKVQKESYNREGPRRTPYRRRGFIMSHCVFSDESADLRVMKMKRAGDRRAGVRVPRTSLLIAVIDEAVASPLC